MASVRQHLKESHLRAAEGSIASAKFHKAMAGHFATLAECAKGADWADGQKTHEEISAAHQTMCDACTKDAEYHNERAKDLSESMKADGAENLEKRRNDLSKLQPTNVSALAPNAPRAVPRAGQREMGGDRPEVPAEFAKLVSVEDGEG
jgi:hypothetical protein